MDRHIRDQMKYNEFHKGGQKEDRTTAEIIEIAYKLDKGDRITCTTWVMPNLRLTIVLDNRPYVRVLDVTLALNANIHEVQFVRRENQGVTRIGRVGPWRDGAEMNIVDVVESFQLDDDKIDNQHPGSGYWTGWFLMGFQSAVPVEERQPPTNG
jgi:hypothetical protein